MMPTLSQRLRFFPTESRAIIFPQCRQDCPFLPFINRGGFHGLREETIGSKFGQKPAIFPFFMQFFSLSSPSLSTVAFGHHHSNHYRFVTVSTTSGRLNSSPAAKHTPPIPLSLLQIFFSFFLPALPPETSSNRRPHHCTSSSTARQPPRQVAFFSSFSSSSSSPSPPPLSLLTG